MNDYEIKDYSLFDSGVTANKTFLKELETFKNEVQACQETLADTSNFEGPIADDMQNMFTTILNDLNTIYNSLNNMNTKLTTIKENYEKSDSTATSTVTSAEETVKSVTGQVGGKKVTAMTR